MEVNAPRWDDLKADGRVVCDHPARKLSVYPSTCGLVVLLSVEDGQRSAVAVNPEEVPDLMRALLTAGAEAAEIGQRIEGEYATHLVIEKARGG